MIKAFSDGQLRQPKVLGGLLMYDHASPNGKLTTASSPPAATLRSREVKDGFEVSAIDPVASMQAIDNPALLAVEGQVLDLLAKVLATL